MTVKYDLRGERVKNIEDKGKGEGEREGGEKEDRKRTPGKKERESKRHCSREHKRIRQA